MGILSKACINFYELDFKTIILILSPIIALSSLLINYRTYKAFNRREFIKKQIDVVTQLLIDLHNQHFELFSNIYSGKSGYNGTSHHITIFELNECIKNNFFSGDDFDDNKPVFFENKCNQLLDIKKHIDNPFMPKKIADLLDNFYSSWIHEKIRITDFKENDKAILIKSKFLVEDIYFNKTSLAPYHAYLSNAFAYESWGNFKKCSLNLEESISEWFKNNDIYDLNIRRDFKTNPSLPSLVKKQ
jgi:hypothetical protein